MFPFKIYYYMKGLYQLRNKVGIISQNGSTDPDHEHNTEKIINRKHILSLVCINIVNTHTVQSTLRIQKM